MPRAENLTYWAAARIYWDRDLRKKHSQTHGTIIFLQTV